MAEETERSKKESSREVPQAWRDGVMVALQSTIRRKKLEGLTTREQAKELGLTQSTLNQLLNRKGSLGIHVLIRVREATGFSLDEMLQLRATTEAAKRRARNREQLTEITQRLDAVHALVSVSGPLTRESKASIKKLVSDARDECYLVGGDVGREEKAEQEREERLQAYADRRAAG